MSIKLPLWTTGAELSKELCEPVQDTRFRVTPPEGYKGNGMCTPSPLSHWGRAAGKWGNGEFHRIFGYLAGAQSKLGGQRKMLGKKKITGSWNVKGSTARSWEMSTSVCCKAKAQFKKMQKKQLKMIKDTKKDKVEKC